MKKKVIILIALCCLFIQAAQGDALFILESTGTQPIQMRAPGANLLSKEWD